jgi:hypothetical protein
MKNKKKTLSDSFKSAATFAKHYVSCKLLEADTWCVDQTWARHQTPPWSPPTLVISGHLPSLHLNRKQSSFHCVGGGDYVCLAVVCPAIPAWPGHCDTACCGEDEVGVGAVSRPGTRRPDQAIFTAF